MEFKINEKVFYNEHLGTIVECGDGSCLVSFDDNWSSALYNKDGYSNCYWCLNINLKKVDSIYYIEPGLIVEFSNGEIGIIVSYEKGWYIITINDLCYCYDKDFDDDLNCRPNHDYNIKTIYKATKPINLNVEENIKNCSIIWTREKSSKSIIELTMQEIANKFGIPVEQLKIKE